MRWRSRLALGAAVLFPTMGLAAPAADALRSSRNPGAVERSSSVHRSTESPLIAPEPAGGRPSHHLRPVLADISTAAPIASAAWVLVGFLAALTVSVRPRIAARGRAPPLRFL
jgi:hypothetical protein